MISNDLTRLQADLEAAEAEITRVREVNAQLAEAFRAEPNDDARERLKRAAASLAALRDRVEAAKVTLELLKRTGSPHGLLAEDGKVVGSAAVAIPGGASGAERARRIEEAIGEALIEAARELGVVLGAAPEKYTREKPGRDEQGRTVLEVLGRVEGDVLVPAVSRSARLMRS